jgi:hypothetical protein
MVNAGIIHFAGLVTCLPMWLAPNLITLAGTLCVLAAYILNIAFNPGFTGGCCINVSYLLMIQLGAIQALATSALVPCKHLHGHHTFSRSGSNIAACVACLRS